MRKLFAHLFAFTLFIAGIIFTLNSDILNQHNNDILYPVKYLFLPKNNEISINQLIGKPTRNSQEENKKNPTTESQRIYLLVLDESSSITWDTNMPDWYSGTVKKIRDRLGEKFQYYMDSHRGFDLCKMTLYQVLLDIENQNAGFAILKLGDSTKRIYPTAGNILYCPSNSGNIGDAIECVENQITSNEQKNTDFNGLFNHIIGNYLNSIPQSSAHNELPIYSLIIISDLVHSVEKAIKQQLIDANIYTEKHLQAKLLENHQTLKETTKQLLGNKSLVQILITSNNGNQKVDPNEVYMWELLNKKNMNFPPQNIPIGKYSYLNLMLPKYCHEGITFYHNGEKLENREMSAMLRINQAGDYKMALRFSNHHPEGKMRFQVFNANGKPSTQDGRDGYLDFAGGVKNISQLDEDQTIQLSYSRELPSAEGITELILYLPHEDKQCFFVPVYFKKKFTPENLRIILFVYAYIFFYIVYCLFQLKHLGYLIQTCKGYLYRIKEKLLNSL